MRHWTHHNHKSAKAYQIIIKSNTWSSPGAIVTTLIPCLAKSRATGNVIPTTPALEAEYAACPI